MYLYIMEAYKGGNLHTPVGWVTLYGLKRVLFYNGTHIGARSIKNYLT